MDSSNVIKLAEIDQSDTSNNFLENDIGVLLKGWVKKWPAYEKWNLDFFKENYGDAITPLSNYKKHSYQLSKQKPKVALRDYIEVIQGLKEGDEVINKDSYVAGWHYLKNAPSIANDIITPDCFKNNLIDRIQNIINFDHTSMFIGHADVESPLHTDSFFVCTWLAVVQGRKVIRIVPPIDYKEIYNGLDVFDEAVVNNLKEKDIPVYEAVIEAGDIVYIPPGHWHQVRNENFTIAVSNNFVDSFHFLTFEQQLRARLIKPLVALWDLRDQIILDKTEGSDSFTNFNQSKETLVHSKFIENERKLMDYFSKENKRTVDLLDYLDKTHTDIEQANLT